MPNQDFLVDCPGRQDIAVELGLYRLKRDVWYAYNRRVGQRCTESEIFDSDSTPASDEYIPTPLRLRNIFKYWTPLLLKLQSECFKLLAVSKRPCLVFALKRLKNRIKPNC